MEIRESSEGDVVMISLEGSVRGSEETNALETSLASTLKAGARLLVVDCAAAGQLTRVKDRSGFAIAAVTGPETCDQL